MITQALSTQQDLQVKLPGDATEDSPQQWAAMQQQQQ